MPQLIPFYFVNQFTVALLATSLLVALLSRYLLPRTVAQHAVRAYLTRLHR